MSKTLLPWQQRVVEEAAHLLMRRTKLRGFIFSDAYYDLPLAERQDLTEQMGYMDRYYLILDRRIARFM